MQRRQLLLAAGAAAVLTACGGGDDDNDRPDIADLAAQDPELSLLSAALAEAGLDDTLAGDGPFTVFAPTDAAFGDLLDELGITLEALLADRDLLTAVLTYHVVAAEVAAADVPVGHAVTTVQGGIFKPAEGGSGLTLVDGRNRVAQVIATDIEASNGIVHKIDRVLLPADQTIVETAQSLPDFSILVEAVVAAGLVDALSAAGPLTVFAPTNAAFAALLDELGVTKEALLADTDLLTAVLTYHVVDGRVLQADVPLDTAIATLQGGTFQVDADGRITDGRDRSANLVQTDVLASNGVIHVIDRVILPPA